MFLQFKYDLFVTMPGFLHHYCTKFNLVSQNHYRTPQDAAASRLFSYLNKSFWDMLQHM